MPALAAGRAAAGECWSASLKKQRAAIGLFLLTCSCVAPRQAPPTPAPKPAPPPPAPTPTPVKPEGDDWRDWPITPGIWTYRATETGGNARFAAPGAQAAELMLICARQTREIMIVRPAAAAVTGTMTIQTSSGANAVPIRAGSATLPASSPLLDQMGYSRGRFMVTIEGVPRLIAPAWPEVLRVTEDCR
ncbi:MAG: hypothetical protein DI623_10220 [Sphingomonas sanxanigenens]|uniref:Lipoprotein n=1 Tax=Sphingomonas sanxanigenens TaxID=397260 RepID=A0A2W5C2G2_9SPHN|nr:MAG: hypothetical protein DI623_10220 [Sphingomonas sanxanigenens]